MAHGTDVIDLRRSACRHTPFLQSRKCCLLFYKKNLTERSARLLPTTPTPRNEIGRRYRGRARCTQEITAAWARYAEEVMRHTSEASQALLRARTLTEMLEVQAKLLRENMQAFLDQSVRIAESASRMASRPLEELKAASTGRPRTWL